MTEITITHYEDLPFIPLAEGGPIRIAVLWRNPPPNINSAATFLLDRKGKSSFIHGIEDDALHVTDHLAAYLI
jgi:hypothetical protein